MMPLALMLKSQNVNSTMCNINTKAKFDQFKKHLKEDQMDQANKIKNEITSKFLWEIAQAEYLIKKSHLNSDDLYLNLQETHEGFQLIIKAQNNLLEVFCSSKTSNNTFQKSLDNLNEKEIDLINLDLENLIDFNNFMPR